MLVSLASSHVVGFAASATALVNACTQAKSSTALRLTSGMHEGVTSSGLYLNFPRKILKETWKTTAAPQNKPKMKRP